MKVFAGLAALITYFLRQAYGSSWLWAVPIYFTLNFVAEAYRILIYERFVSPLAKIPGPKVLHSEIQLMTGTLAVGRIRGHST